MGGCLLTQQFIRLPLCLFVCLFRFESELVGVVGGVGEWWGPCEEMCQWLGEAEESLVAHKPLASSLDIIQQQKQSVQVRRQQRPTTAATAATMLHFASRHVAGACRWDGRSQGVI